MINFAHDSKLEMPKTWKVSETGTVVMKCPNGHIGVLDDHFISPGGIVEPSVVCPYEECGFHDHVVLVGWESDHMGMQI